MQKLSNLDASFLHLENAEAPMHVGGLLCFGQPADGPMTLERLRRHIAGRLQTARVFRQRLHMPLALLDHPVWVEDAGFNLDNHLTHVELPGAVDKAALDGLCSGFFAVPLRRDRPLWEIRLVTSRRAGEDFAIILKVHHAALDGISAEAVITGLLDISVQPRELPADTWQPEPLPSLPEDIGRCVTELRRERAGVRALGQSLRDIGGRLLQRTLSLQDLGSPRYFSAPATPFNSAITPERQYFGVQLSLSAVKAVKNSRPGLTVNDVVLAVCSGGLRRYLAEGGQLPARSLIAMTPVSRRAAGGGSGNQVSSMLVNLATDVAAPLQRLGRIHESAAHAKAYSREITVDSLLDELPVAGPAAVLSAYARWRLGRRLPAIFNTVITNVPGSPLPLFLDGAPLRSLSGMVGVYDGMALSFVVMSYLDQLSIGITSTPAVLPDPARLGAHLEAALQELVEAAARAGAPEGNGVAAGSGHAPAPVRQRHRHTVSA